MLIDKCKRTRQTKVHQDMNSQDDKKESRARPSKGVAKRKDTKATKPAKPTERKTHSMKKAKAMKSVESKMDSTTKPAKAVERKVDSTKKSAKAKKQAPHIDYHNYIEVVGARENNLKNISLVIPKNELVVLTGLSGSGKSTLAFDTLYAEGQRRYIESLSSYARQFLDKVGKPDVDKINGLTPAIAIDQKTTSKNPRSTVGTITEIYDYLRLLYARVGEQHCYKCGEPITNMTQEDIINEIHKLNTMQGTRQQVAAIKPKGKKASTKATSALQAKSDSKTKKLTKKELAAEAEAQRALEAQRADAFSTSKGGSLASTDTTGAYPKGSDLAADAGGIPSKSIDGIAEPEIRTRKVMILAPIIKDKKGVFLDTIAKLRDIGIVRALIDGTIVRLDEEIELAKSKKHTIKAIINRLKISEANSLPIAESVEKALALSYGEVEVIDVDTKESFHFSKHLACFNCKISYEELEPLSFSFNSPKGACPTCNGLGMTYSIDIKKILNKSLPLNDGGIKFIFGFNRNYYSLMFEGFCEIYDVDKTLCFDELDESRQKALLYGGVKEVDIYWRGSTIMRPWQGILQIAYNMFKDEKDIADYMSESECNECHGNRLKKASLAVKVGGYGIADLISMPIEGCYEFFADAKNFSYLSHQNATISAPILKELDERLFFLYDVGLGYLTLKRDARSISGGEAQRIRIASQIGSGLTGVMYILDEPSIGLHERDTMRLIKTMRSLQAKGNTVIVVEHDKETICHADYIVDVGPRAGKEGGEIVFSGSYPELLKANTITSQYLNGTKKIERSHNRDQDKYLSINNVSINNIEDLSVKVPLGNFVCVTGVSGSGKSSLILQTLLPVAKEILNNAKKIKKVDKVEILGLEHLDKVIYLDQSPIGRTPRSNPATYTGMMDDIRNVFAMTKESKMRGYSISRFSFNVKGGRCEKCCGEGEIKIEMHFLPDIMVVCDECRGNKYNRQTLEVFYNGKNIADVLRMSVAEAYEFFKNYPKIAAKLKTLVDVGLGYITLGQNATTLSGGEAQRIKLAKELSRRDTGKTLYILDEPTTGLHFADVNKLVHVLHKLVDLGNSIIVIEHSLDVIANADYIIDLGPEGGSKGGEVIATGNIAKVIKSKGSYTAHYLKEYLKG